jgi:leader peptidase (prepilin peptidase)/N-methyltransferase
MFHNDLIMTVMTGIWLLLCSWQDFRKKKIHIALIFLGGIGILICSFLSGELVFSSRIAGFSLGLTLLLLNPVTSRQIGIGDGLIVSILGIGLGFNQLAFILTYSLFGAAILAVGLILFRKAGRKRTMPFVPFLFLGYLGGLIS